MAYWKKFSIQFCTIAISRTYRVSFFYSKFFVLFCALICFFLLIKRYFSFFLLFVHREWSACFIFVHFWVNRSAEYKKSFILESWLDWLSKPSAKNLHMALLAIAWYFITPRWAAWEVVTKKSAKKQIFWSKHCNLFLFVLFLEKLLQSDLEATIYLFVYFICNYLLGKGDLVEMERNNLW